MPSSLPLGFDRHRLRRTIRLALAALVALLAIALGPAPTALAETPPILDGLVDPVYYSHSGRAVEYEGFYPEANATLLIVEDPSIDPDHIWLAWIVSKQFNDASYGVNKHSSWPRGHEFDDLLESDLQRLDIENLCGEMVLDITMDLLDGPPYHGEAYATASGYGVDVYSTESVRNYINGGDWTKVAFDTSMAANLNDQGYCAAGDCSLGGTDLLVSSPPWLDGPNYVPIAAYSEWEYRLVWELRIHRSVFVTASCPGGSILGIGTNPVELHASPSKIGISPVTLFRVTSAIGDYVWLDADRDGVQDVTEPGIANVTLDLYTDYDGNGLPDGGGYIGSATTDLYGRYLFPDLGAGPYVVTVTDRNGVLAGYSLTTGSTDPHGVITLEKDTRYLQADFGYYPGDPSKAAIGNLVWSDADNDGMQDLGESGIGGVTLRLLADNDRDGMYSDVVATTTTADDGSYMFTNLTPGSYVVDVTDTSARLAGYALTVGPHSNPDPTVPIRVSAGQVYLDADFGYYRANLGIIGNQIWYDADADGLYEPASGETGFGDVTVSLIKDSNGNGIRDVGELTLATLTAFDGTYLFTGLALDDGDGDADYLVTVTDNNDVLARYRKSTGPNPGQNNNSQSDPYPVALSAASPSNLTADFGFYIDQGKGMVGDRVWLDADGDGQQEAGEPGIENVWVELWSLKSNGALNAKVGVVHTDGNGNYYYPNLDLGVKYRATVLASNFAAGGALYGLKPTNQGLDNAADSITLASGSNIDLTLDFGYKFDDAQPLYTIGTHVWQDTDRDGYRDPDELGIGDVTLALYRDSNGDGLLQPGEMLLNEQSTAADGSYLFRNVAAGKYIVVVTDKNHVLTGRHWSDGLDHLDDWSQVTTYAVSVNPGNVVYADFGFYQGTEPPPTPTAVTLAAFRATPVRDGLLLTWETASEIASLGFNIHRSAPKATGPARQLNDALIPSQAFGSMVGAQYEFLDRSVVAGSSYAYWLEAIDLSGHAELHGPLVAKAVGQSPLVQLGGSKQRVALVDKISWFRTIAWGHELAEVYVAFAPSRAEIVTSPHMRYRVAGNEARVWNGSKWSAARTPGVISWAHSPFMALRMLGYTVTWLDDGSLQLQWPVLLKSPAVGTHRVFIRAVDAAGMDSGWVDAAELVVN